jgi:hypothetical protein
VPSNVEILEVVENQNANRLSDPLPSRDPNNVLCLWPGDARFHQLLTFTRENDDNKNDIAIRRKSKRLSDET